MSQITNASTHLSDSPSAQRFPLPPLWPATIEFVLLFVAAPLLYFPDRIQPIIARACNCSADWTVWLGLGILLAIWPLRYWFTGSWMGRMPAAWAIWFWFLVMLPVAIWAAPPTLREQYAWPRAYILIWNFHLFWSVLSHASRSKRLFGWGVIGWVVGVQAIAFAAPFGMEPRAKLPVIGAIQDLIPRPLLGVFSGAEAGFSTNQVAGVLLYVLPLLVVLSVAGRRHRNWLWWILVFCTGWMGATLILSQSRGGLLGMGAATAAMLLLTRRWGWTVLGVLSLVVAAVIYFMPPTLLDVISDAPGVDALGGVVTVQGFRTLVWASANAALRDFFFTGMGLGTFRSLVYLLYPPAGVLPTYDLAHAHNFFLQTGLDFGVPGLVAILVMYGAAIVQLVRLDRLPVQAMVWAKLPFVTPRILAIGWMGCMVGQTMYSLFDAVAMGSKPNFVWWWWLALIFAAGNCLLPKKQPQVKELA